MALPQLVSLGPGQMAYGGYVFPISFVLSEIDMTLQLDTVDMPFAPGSYAPTGKLDPKQFQLAGTIGGPGAILDQQGLVMLTADAVQAELDRLFATMDDGEQALQWRPDRYCLAQMSSPKVTYEAGQGYRFAAVQVGFVANDPRSYSVAQRTASVQTATNGALSTIHVGNQGSDNAYPTITLSFQSQCVNPAVAIGTRFANQSISLSFSGSFSPSDSVVIVCEPRNRAVLLNGVKTWSVLNLGQLANTIPGDTNIFPYLTPTSTACPVVVQAASGQCTATVVYQDTWV